MRKKLSSDVIVCIVIGTIFTALGIYWDHEPRMYAFAAVCFYVGFQYYNGKGNKKRDGR
ncbi:hypothetical protein JZO70_08735 [Enterococcus sp. 669A]|uniref:Uncharacterized protein n=1 Tax=Candidatus Enterococcus moelleringii TaxID=2815325 RepID=A0ABS3LB54_9ENTE|nr:hypothetical protein [Enterococcus sp. 669A]MBO1306243.1 hypothetical protein [Enterococcus sp. 669A]